MHRAGLAGLCLAMLLYTGIATAGWPAAVTHYLQTLSGTEAAEPPVSLQPLFGAALAVQDAVMTIHDGQAWLETLDARAYEELRNRLRGLRLSRGYDVYAAPDPDFLLDLARHRGEAVDLDFFREYRASWNDDLLPVYLRQTSRVTPCVRYAEGMIADRYLAWTDFRARHPDAYAGHVAQFVADLEEAVALGTCACGNQASVEQELHAFLTLYPQTPAAPAIQARLRQLDEEPERQPVHCR